MVCGCSTTTFNKYRIEGNVLYFDGHNAELNPAEYEVKDGTFDDACFATQFIAAKMKNYVLLNQNLEVLRGYIDEEVQKSKSFWSAISFGVLVNNPEHFGDVCMARPAAIFSAIPHNWEDLKVIGALLNKEVANPVLMPLHHDLNYYGHMGINLENFTEENDPKFNGTNFLEMAQAAYLLHEPCHLSYTCPYDDGFCDRFIVNQWDEDCDVCVVTAEMAEKCFGELPTSYRISGMPVMPVRIKATDEFKRQTGYNGDEVNIVSAGGYNRDLNKFMGLWIFVSKRQFFWTRKSSAHKRQVVFTHDGFGYISHDGLEAWRKKFGVAGTI